MFPISEHVMDTTQIALRIEKSSWWSWPMAMIFHCHIVKSNSIERILLRTEFELTAHKLNQPFEQSIGGCFWKQFRFKFRWMRWNFNLIFAKTAHFDCVIIYFPLSSATAFRSHRNLNDPFHANLVTFECNSVQETRRRKEREHF